MYQRRTGEEFKIFLSVAHASQPVERAENLEWHNQLSGMCWGAVNCSSHTAYKWYRLFESIILNHPVCVCVCVCVCVHTLIENQYCKYWRSWLRQCAKSRKVAGSIPDGFIGIFHWHNHSCLTMAPGVDSASNKNEYQQYFLEGWRRPVRRADNLTIFMCRQSRNFGKLNNPQHEGLLQACNEIDLPHFNLLCPACFSSSVSLLGI